MRRLYARKVRFSRQSAAAHLSNAGSVRSRPHTGGGNVASPGQISRKPIRGAFSAGQASLARWW